MRGAVQVIKRVPSKHPVIDGVRYYDRGNPLGREVCVTAAAWARRKMEVLVRDKFTCQLAPLVGRRKHLVSDDEGWTADHITTRGHGGGKRNDNRRNLRLTCNACHTAAHAMNIHQRKNEQEGEESDDDSRNY